MVLLLSWSSNRGLASAFKTPNCVSEGPAARMSTLFGTLPCTIKPAIITLAPVPTCRRVEIFPSVAGQGVGVGFGVGVALGVGGGVGRGVGVAEGTGVGVGGGVGVAAGVDVGVGVPVGVAVGVPGGVGVGVAEPLHSANLKFPMRVRQLELLIAS